MEHFTFHLLRRTRMPPTTPERSQSARRMCPVMDVRFVSCNTKKKKKKSLAVTSEAIYLLHCILTPLPVLLPPLLLCLCSFHSACSLLDRQVKVYPRTTHHFPHMAPGGGTKEAPGKGKPKQLTQHCGYNHMYKRTGYTERRITSFSFLLLLFSPFYLIVLLISVSSKVYVY